MKAEENISPKISIIVPVYKVEDYLQRCIDSILLQTFTDWELLLVDDGSPDQSGKICDIYTQKDSRIKTFHNTNHGASYSRFFGVEKSVGDFIIFVDSDDSIPKDALQLLYNYGIKYQADITIGGYKRIHQNRKTDYCGFTFDVISNEYLLFLLVTGNWKLYGPVAKLFKRELFKKNIPDIPKDICVGEDLLMNVYLATQAKTVVLIPYPVYHYFQIRTSTVHTFKYTLEYVCLYLQELKKILVQNNISNIDILLSHYKINIAYNLMLDDSKDSIDYKSEIIIGIIESAKNIKKTKKEKIILCLLKYKIPRVIYKKVIRKYILNCGK